MSHLVIQDIGHIEVENTYSHIKNILTNPLVIFIELEVINPSLFGKEKTSKKTVNVSKIITLDP
jgi:hypothetical protein